MGFNVWSKCRELDVVNEQDSYRGGAASCLAATVPISCDALHHIDDRELAGSTLCC